MPTIAQIERKSRRAKAHIETRPLHFGVIAKNSCGKDGCNEALPLSIRAIIRYYNGPNRREIDAFLNQDGEPELGAEAEVEFACERFNAHGGKL